MPTYISPNGNPEIWAEKPQGYFTPEEWAAAHPAPPPEPPTLEEAVKAKLAEIMSAYTAAFAPINAIYPAQEREGWPIQYEEASKLLEYLAAAPEATAADQAVVAPTLALLVAERALAGESIAAFAEKVIQNNTFYRAFYANLTGQQQRMFRDVQSAAATPGVTGAEVAAYPVEFKIPGAE